MRETTQTHYQAHWKVDGRTGEWLHFGVAYGRTSTLHLTMFTPEGRLRAHWTVPLPRPVFLHDWFVTERHCVFILHPGLIHLRGLAAMLLGWRSPADVLRWQPALGNLVLVLEPSRPQHAAPARSRGRLDVARAQRLRGPWGNHCRLYRSA